MLAGRLKCGGKEDQRIVAYGCGKTKKLIFGMEGENVVAYERLPGSPWLINDHNLHYDEKDIHGLQF